MHLPYTSADYLSQATLLLRAAILAEGQGGWDEPFATAAVLFEDLGVHPHLPVCSSPPPPHSELEDFVEDLKKDSTSASRVVTLKDVEDGAFLLRQVGEAVATLKGEPPP